MTVSATLPVRPPCVVVLATSGGGLDALTALLGALPADFPGALLVVQHRWPTSPDYLPGILAGRTRLPVRSASDCAPLRGSQVLVAPAGRQLEMTASWCVSTSRTDRVNFCCPSADVLLSSVARHAGPGAIACVLTGGGLDGAAGVKSVHSAGGFVLAQSPRSAEFPAMPQAAIDTGKVDLVLPLRELAFALCTLAALEKQAA